MALTLTSGITADADEFVVTGAVPANVGPDFRFRIDDELLRLQGFGPHTEIVGAYARQWAGKDPQRWLVERGVEHSTPASHAQGADVLAANDVFASSDDLTPPSPFDGGSGGSGIPQGGPLTEDLDADGFAILNVPQSVYVQPSDPGAVGAGKLWVDTTAETPQRVLIRNPDDDNWWDVLATYTALGIMELRTLDGELRLRRRSADDTVTRAEYIMEAGSNSIRAMDDVGTPIVEWRVGTDGFDGHINDEMGTARVTHEAFAGASEDADAHWEWLVRDANNVDKARITLNESGIELEGALNLTIANAPEVPASPTEQDIVDALIALGLVTQAAP